jgi:hypothetical protein
MAKKLLNTKERWYADSHKEAEEIVADAKQDEALTMQKIHEKHNKNGFYYLVDLERTYSTPKEEMEKRPEKDDIVDCQLSIEDVHEGFQYSVDQDGSVSVAATEDETEQDLSF